jgi:hypothetical protein
MRWGYGGRRRSYDGEEGGGGELDAPRTKNGERRARVMLTVDESRDGGDGWTVMSFGHGRRRGSGQRPLTGGTHSSVFSELKIPPDENSSK